MKQQEIIQLRDRLNQSVAQDLAWYEVGGDMAKGVFAGGVDAAEETYQFTRWAADSLVEGAGYVLGQEWEGFDDETERLFFEPPRPVTMAGQITEDISQFGFGLVGAGKLKIGQKLFAGSIKGATKAVSKKIGKPKEVKEGGKLDKISASAGNSAASSMIAHNPYEERLSDIVQKVPALQNPVTEFLQSDEDDTQAERRLKMAAEDLMLTGPLEGLFAIARGVKRVRKGADSVATEKEVTEELTTVNAKETKKRVAKSNEHKKRVKAADKEQKALEEAGDDISKVDLTNTIEVMADDLDRASFKAGRSRQDVLLRDNKGTLVQKAKALGLPMSDKTTKKQLAEAIDDKLSMPRFITSSGTTVKKLPEEVSVTPSKTGVQKPKQPKLSNAAQVKALVAGVKEPKDITEVFSEAKNVKFFNRTKEGDVLTTDYVDDVASVLQETMNAAKPMLDRVRGKQGVQDVFEEAAVRASEMTGLTPKEIMSVGFRHAKSIEEATFAVHAIESMLKESGERMYRLFENPKYDADPNIQIKAQSELENFNQLLAGVQGIETGMGRALRMRQEKIFDLKALDESVKSMGGKETLEQFRTVLRGTGGDLSKISRAAANIKGRGAVFKGTAITGELFRSMILFNIKTHVTNTLSGFTETVLVPMERYAGSYLMQPFIGGKAAREIRDDVTYHLMGLSSTFKDSIEMSKASLKAERNYLDPANTKLDGNEVQNKINSSFVGIKSDTLLGRNLDTIGKITRGSLRALGAEDEFFKQINYRSRVFADGMQEAKLKFPNDPKAAQKYALKRVSDSLDGTGRGTDMEALQYSREITFTEDLLDGSKALKLQQFVQQHPSFQIFLPFIRTPTNLIVRAAQRTPLVNFASKRYRDTLKNGTPAEKAQMIGRTTLGTTFLGGALIYAMEGKITGAGPALPDQNRLWRNAGNQPYSIRIGDEWVSYNRFDPLFMPVGLMANVFDINKHMAGSEVEDVFSTAVFALSTTLQDKAYLQGISNLFSALQTDDPNQIFKVTNITDGILTSFLPAAPLQVVEGIQAMGDDNYPELREAVGLADKFQRRIPMMVDNLPKKYNWLTGESIRNPDAFSTGFPIVPDKTTEFVGAELMALNYPFKGPARRINKIELTSEQLSDYNQFMGTTRIGGLTLMQALQKIMKSPQYRAGDENRVYDGEFQTNEIKAISKIMSTYKRAARQQLFAKYPDFYMEYRNRKINQKAGTRLLETNR